MSELKVLDLRPYLPSPFRLLESQERKKMEHLFDALLSPRQDLDGELGQIFASADPDQFNSQSFLLKDEFIGITQFVNGKLLQQILFPVFNEYLLFRGTLRGFQILFDSCFPGISIQIKERALPRSAITLGSSYLNSDEVIQIGAADLSSVCFEFPFPRDSFNASLLSELQEFLSEEISDGLQFFFEFQKKSVKTVEANQARYFLIGDRL